MNKRNAVRYGSEHLPVSMNTVMISWEGVSPIESTVINCSAHGLKVLLPVVQAVSEMPGKNETVMVKIRNDKNWLTGMCVFATRDQDDLFSMGIYFYNPHDQNYLQDLLYKSLEGSPRVSSFVSHEWEEFVEKLCNSEDPHLRQKGIIKRNSIIAKQKSFVEGQAGM
jgi:hypothetical protein